MCFGSKKDAGGDDVAPRPASVDKKASHGQQTASQDAHYAQQQPGPSSQVDTAWAPPPVHVQPPAASSSQAGAMPPSYDYASQPPPSNAPQHDWEGAVPDTSLFPPPPDVFSTFDKSPTSNASDAEATAGADWCRKHGLTHPMTIDQAGRAALQTFNIRLMEPAGFNGRLNWLARGRWEASSARRSPDRCLISYPPLYLAREPATPKAPKTIYYEVKLRPGSPTVFVSLGFTALPYPSFRLPGWHRGSLAVHGDDGHRYIHDPYGGKVFTAPFVPGETYGIGMTFKAIDGDQDRFLVDVFFTRNGVLSGGWNLHEETDAEQDSGVVGLEGMHDLCAAIGTYDGVSLEAIFEPSMWLYQAL